MIRKIILLTLILFDMENKIVFIKRVLFCLECYAISGDVALFIASQFALESNFGSSNLALRYNNYSGMRTPKSRITTVLKSDLCSDFARYHSLDDCIVDYLLLLAWNHFTQFDLRNLDSFKSKILESQYCPERSYLDRINSIYVQFKNQLQNE